MAHVATVSVCGNDTAVSEAINTHWIPSTDQVMPNFASGILALSLSCYPCLVDNPHAIITAFPTTANVLASTPGHRWHLHQRPGEGKSLRKVAGRLP